MDWFEAIFISFLVVGIGGGFLALMIYAFVSGLTENKNVHDVTLIVLVLILIVAMFIVTPKIRGDGTSSEESGSGYSGSNSGSSHKCCICGDEAYGKYGDDYWCADHYYMAKVSEGDLDP